MKFKEFNDWCNDRAADGCWGMCTAMFCIDIVRQVNSQPFWKKERKWQELNANHAIENDVVTPINNKIAELYGAAKQ